MANENNGETNSRTPIIDRLFNLAKIPGEKDDWRSAFESVGVEIQSGKLTPIILDSEQESLDDSNITDDE